MAGEGSGTVLTPWNSSKEYHLNRGDYYGMNLVSRNHLIDIADTIRRKRLGSAQIEVNENNIIETNEIRPSDFALNIDNLTVIPNYTMINVLVTSTGYNGSVTIPTDLTSTSQILTMAFVVPNSGLYISLYTKDIGVNFCNYDSYLPLPTYFTVRSTGTRPNYNATSWITDPNESQPFYDGLLAANMFELNNQSRRQFKTLTPGDTFAPEWMQYVSGSWVNNAAQGNTVIVYEV